MQMFCSDMASAVSRSPVFTHNVWGGNATDPRRYVAALKPLKGRRFHASSGLESINGRKRDGQSVRVHVDRKPRWWRKGTEKPRIPMA